MVSICCQICGLATRPGQRVSIFVYDYYKPTYRSVKSNPLRLQGLLKVAILVARSRYNSCRKFFRRLEFNVTSSSSAQTPDNFEDVGAVLNGYLWTLRKPCLRLGQKFGHGHKQDMGAGLRQPGRYRPGLLQEVLAFV